MNLFRTDGKQQLHQFVHAAWRTPSSRLLETGRCKGSISLGHLAVEVRNYSAIETRIS